MIAKHPEAVHRLVRPRRPVEWLDRLLERPDAARAVRAMPAQELYLAIAGPGGLGLADALDLLRLATPEQIAACLDIDCWDKDRLAPGRMLQWLATVAELGPQRLGMVVQAMDHEAVVSFLQHYVRAYELKDEEAPEEPEGHLYYTPDTFYAVDILEPSGVVDRLLESLYMAGLELGRRVVMGARWDVGPETEETAYRFRSARMADLGYFDYYDALPIYSFLDPRSVRLHEGSAAPLPEEAGSAAVNYVPGLVPSPLSDALNDDSSALGRALAALGPRQREHIQQQLLTLINQALSADRVDPADVPAARRVMERVAGCLSLGIEYLVREGDEGTPAEARGVVALHGVALPRLFRLGHSLTLQLAKLASALRQGGLVTLAPQTDPASLLLPPASDVLRLLLQPRPMYSKLLDAGARAEGPGSETARPFRTLADIARTATVLEGVKAAGDLLTLGLGLRADNLGEALRGKSPDAAGVRLHDLLGTMVANLLLQRPPAMVPLPRRDLVALRQAALGLAPAGPELSAPARALVRESLRQRVGERALNPEEASALLSPAAERFIDQALQRLGQGLYALPASLAPDHADVVPSVPGLVLA